MFNLRMFRSRRNIFNLGRRVNGLQNSEPQITRWQTVRIRPNSIKLRGRRFKPLNLFVGTVVIVLCYELYTRSVLAPILDALDDAYDELPQEEKESIEEEVGEGLFFPFPGTTRLVEPLPYRGSDPEWQAFVKVSKDVEAQKKIQEGLTTICCKVLEGTPKVVRRCGSGMKPKNRLLTIHYPSYPPPTFSRKGLVWGDDAIYIVEDPVDSNLVFSLQRMLWPSAVGRSIWAFANDLLSQNFNSAAKLLGLRSSQDQNGQQPPNIPPPLVKMAEQVSKIPPHDNKSKASESTPTSSGSDQDKKSPPADSPSSPSDQSPTSPNVHKPSVPSSEDATGKEDATQKGKKAVSAADLYTMKKMKEHTAGPWAAFKQKYLRSHAPTRDFPPRGSFNVSGTIVVEAPKGWITLDVWAWYHPTLQWHGRSMIITVKSIRPKVQRPKA